MKRMTIVKAAVGLTLMGAWASASATDIAAVPCAVIREVFKALGRIGPSLVAAFLLYGAGKYVYSAEDPGGRKQGKDIFIHALIAGIIMVMVSTVATTLGIIPKMTAVCGFGMWP